MVDLLGRNEPSMNVISFAGRKMKALERTRMVRRECQISRTPRWYALFEGSEVPGLRHRHGKGNAGNHQEFPIGENDRLGNVNEHLHVARCDETCPEARHHVLSRNLALPDKLERNQNPWTNIPIMTNCPQRGRNAPHCANLPRSSVEPMKSCIRVKMPVRYCVEYLAGGDHRDNAVYDSSDHSVLLAFKCEEGKRGLWEMPWLRMGTAERG